MLCLIHLHSIVPLYGPCMAVYSSTLDIGLRGSKQSMASVDDLRLNDFRRFAGAGSGVQSLFH